MAIADRGARRGLLGRSKSLRSLQTRVSGGSVRLARFCGSAKKIRRSTIRAMQFAIDGRPRRRVQAESSLQSIQSCKGIRRKIRAGEAFKMRAPEITRYPKQRDIFAEKSHGAESFPIQYSRSRPRRKSLPSETAGEASIRSGISLTAKGRYSLAASTTVQRPDVSRK